VLKTTEKDKAKLNKMIMYKMNNSSPSSLSSTAPPKVNNNSNNKENDVITLTEKIKLKKDQYEVLKVICDTYQTSLSEYMQQALVEAMRFDIEEGNFSDALLEKIGGEESKKDNSSSSSPSTAPLDPDLMNSDLDLLNKLQTETP
jgi:hypothetical protein